MLNCRHRVNKSSREKKKRLLGIFGEIENEEKH